MSFCDKDTPLSPTCEHVFPTRSGGPPDSFFWFLVCYASTQRGGGFGVIMPCHDQFQATPRKFHLFSALKSTNLDSHGLRLTPPRSISLCPTSLSFHLCHSPSDRRLLSLSLSLSLSFSLSLVLCICFHLMCTLIPLSLSTLSFTHHLSLTLVFLLLFSLSLSICACVCMTFCHANTQYIVNDFSLSLSCTLSFACMCCVSGSDSRGSAHVCALRNIE